MRKSKCLLANVNSKTEFWNNCLGRDSIENCCGSDPFRIRARGATINPYSLFICQSMSPLCLAFLKTVKIKLFRLQLVEYMRKHVISSPSSSRMKARINKPNVFSVYAGFVTLCWGSFLPCTGLHCTCQRYQGRPVRSSTQNQSPAIKSVPLWAIEAATLDRLWSDPYGLNAQLVFEPWDVFQQCVVWGF